MNIILGIIIIAVGALIAVKSEWMLDNFGRIPFFEKYLGVEGGSRLGYKLFGIASIFVGSLIMTDLIGDLLGWILSPLTRYSDPGGPTGR